MTKGRDKAGMRIAFLAAALFAAPALGQVDPASEVSERRLQSDVETLVSFGTRHTLSSADNPARGIGAARRWAMEELRAISGQCGGCLQVTMPAREVQGRRIPRATQVANVVAVQRGSERPDEVVIVQAHIDSRASDPMDWQSDAPGANDNASGSAVVLEAARILSQNRYPVTIVYALLSGEEQGLYGGKFLADYALQKRWQVKAVLNNDVVGNSCGSDGVCDSEHLRVFSEGPRADLTVALSKAQRNSGGENDSPSRNLSRWLGKLAGEHADGLRVRQVWRTDRMGRGGDQIPFLEKGIPAVRLTVAIEDYEHQHQDVRVENGLRYGDTSDEIDYRYLAGVAELNLRALASLASTPAPPRPVAKWAVQDSTQVSWQDVRGAIGYRIYKRRTDASAWEDRPTAFTAETELMLDGVRGDDWLFGVSAISQDGVESPIASAVPGGAFVPISEQ